MEYFVSENNIKQGPFDLIAMIKKIKNGSLNENTLISEKYDGVYREAAKLENVANLIREHSNPTNSGRHDNLKMTFMASFHEGVELWIRHVLDYTILAGLFMAAGYGIETVTHKFLPEGSMVPSYLSVTIIMALFFEFCHYVLETKRSQGVEFKEWLRVMRRTLMPFIVVSAILSTFVLVFSFGQNPGLAATLIIIIIMTFLIFMPFLATDSNMGVLRAAKLSFQKVKSFGGDNFGVVLAMVAINLFAAVLPAMMLRELLGIGLFISLPVTIASLAYIYDQIFV